METGRGQGIREQVYVFLKERVARQRGLAGEVEQEMRAVGLCPTMRVVERGMDLYSMAREAGERPGAVLVAAGGDGTVNAVAAAVTGTPGCMGVLPLGLRNRFAKAVGLPLGVKEAVRAIAQGRARPVDVGEVNGLVFVHHASIGFYPGFEADSHGSKGIGWVGWRATALAAARTLLEYREHRVKLAPADPGRVAEGPATVCTTPFLYVANQIQTTEGQCPELALCVAPGATRLDLVRMSEDMLRHTKPRPPLEWRTMATLTVELDQPAREICLDGVSRRIDGQMRFRVRPGALQVLSGVGLDGPGTGKVIGHTENARIRGKIRAMGPSTTRTDHTPFGAMNGSRPIAKRMALRGG